MFAAITILFCFLVPSVFAFGSIAISISAVRRHVSRRQLVAAAFVMAANVSSVSVLFRDVYTGDSISILPLVMIGTLFVLSIGQFATASVFGAIGRLRQRLA